MNMESSNQMVIMQIATVITLVTLTFSVLLTLITLLTAYKKALKQTGDRINIINDDMEKRLTAIEERQNSLLKKLSEEETQRKYVNHTSLSTQSWNENKICTHIKYEFEIVDLVVRQYDQFDDPSGILAFKRYNLANLLIDLSQNKYVITEDKTIIIDSRRTISRIMESIKSDKVLAERLDQSKCLHDSDELESAVDSVLINAQDPSPNFALTNLEKIKEMAK